jgi:tetratricopeptide (TPR) repeat protein
MKPRLTKTIRYAVCVLAASLLGLAPASFAANQTPAITTSQAADQAYRELDAKNYPAAIQEFQKALAQDPSNFRWREDLAYAELAAGSLSDARKEFEAVYREQPGKLTIALQLGYVCERLNQEQDAEKYFEAATRSADAGITRVAKSALQSLRASRQQSLKQKAYDSLARNRPEEAISLFEQAHQADASDAATTLQLGYLYQATGDMAKAKEMFEAECSNQDPKVALQATSALAEVNRESRWWFGTAYGAPFYQSRFSNEINSFDAKIGLRPSPYLQPYIGLRLTRDTRSDTGNLPEIFSDNSAVFSVGVQSPILGHGTNIYAEAGTALSLLSHPTTGRAVPDYRVGLTWFQPWGVSMAQVSQVSPHGFSPTGNAYGDVGFYSRYNENVIGYFQVREGVNLPTARVLPIQALAAVDLVKDSNGNFYNNVAEVGPEVRIAPFRQLPDLQLRATYLRGFYTVHEVTNPYRPRYGDFRLFLVWSKYF